MKLEDVKKYGVLGRGSAAALAEPADPAGARHAAPESAGKPWDMVTQHSLIPGYMHGQHRLDAAGDLRGDALSVLCADPELAYADLSRPVFLDTETTGLGMGAGTYVFLVGAGYIDGNGFHVRQFFLSDPGEEPEFLDMLSRFLAPFSCLVTFNGRAFDVPILENRYALHRRPPPMADPVHIDLLPAARRLWKHRLDSCALWSLERHVLDIHRSEKDVPGYLIPQLYFAFQSTRRVAELRPVFDHNKQDVLSLAALAVHVALIGEDPHSGLLTHPADFVAAARAFERAGDPERAFDCYNAALERLSAGRERGDCLLRMAALSKRLRNWNLTLSLCEAILDNGGPEALVARVELAKFFEHVEGDTMQAIHHVQHAITLCELYESEWEEAGRRALEHRLARLLNRAIRGQRRAAARRRS